MEPREILVVNTKTQSKKTIISSATTLAELKADLRVAGINYSDMTFYEGISKTEIKTDDSQLPHDVNYKGNITNNLVFMLTTANKKVKSGAVSTRAEAYKTIKDNNLQDEVKKKFGKNFTNCGTNDLVTFVNNKEKKATKTVVEKAPVKVDNNPVTTVKSGVNYTIALTKLVNYLAGKAISTDAANDILAEIGVEYKAPKSTGYSESEINEMFKGIC